MTEEEQARLTGLITGLIINQAALAKVLINTKIASDLDLRNNMNDLISQIGRPLTDDESEPLHKLLEMIKEGPALPLSHRKLRVPEAE